MAKLVVEMSSMDEKKHSVKFYTKDENAPFDNLYVKKSSFPKGAEYNGTIRVTVEFLTDVD